MVNTQTHAAETGHVSYYPEMGEVKPDGQIEARMGHDSRWYIKTTLVLKGRGIVHTNTLTAAQLVPQAQHKVGWHEYRVTRSAFSKLAAQYKIVSESLL